MITAGHQPRVTSTLPPRVAVREVKRARDLRRVGVAALFLLVLAGGTGLLGTRTVESRAQAGGYDLQVTHPAVSRSGHAVRFEVSVRRAGGFDPSQPLRLRFLSAYFDLFDENSFSPQPDTETSDDRYTYLELAPPPGDVLVVSVDTRVEPARNSGERGEVAVLDSAGSPLVVVAFRTRLVP